MLPVHSWPSLLYESTTNPDIPFRALVFCRIATDCRFPFITTTPFPAHLQNTLPVTSTFVASPRFSPLERASVTTLPLTRPNSDSMYIPRPHRRMVLLSAFTNE